MGSFLERSRFNTGVVQESNTLVREQALLSAMSPELLYQIINGCAWMQ
jgi:hypothetical protein